MLAQLLLGEWEKARERLPKPTAGAQRNEAATKDKTFAPRRHGDTEKNIKIDELFWTAGTFGLFQGAVSLFQTLSLQQKDEDTEGNKSPFEIVASHEDFGD